MKTTEFPIPVLVPNGANTVTATRMTNPGKIIGVVFYPEESGLHNPGMVRASVQDSSGNTVSYLQNVNNYRSRDCEYLKGAKPLEIEGGQNLTITIVATSPFTANTNLDFIFIYEVQDSSMHCQNR